MPTIPLPGFLPPPSAALVLTPGTYSQLVLDTLGDVPIDSDPQLARADDAQLALAQSGGAVGGASDALAALSFQRTQILQNAGSLINANLAAARAAVDGSANDVIASTVNTPAQTTPGAPTAPTPPATPPPSATQPITAADFPPEIYGYIVQYPDMTLGAGPAVIPANSPISSTAQPNQAFGNLTFGDPDVWQFSIREPHSVSNSFKAEFFQQYVDVTINPKTAGRIVAVFSITFQDGSDPVNYMAGVIVNP